MSVATWLLSVFTSMLPSAYKAAIDGNFAVAQRVAAAFAPHAQSSPNMTVRLDAGFVFNRASGTGSIPLLTEVAAQSSATITAPSTNPRIDRIVINAFSGAVSVVAGTQAASPVAPDIPFNSLPVAQVLLQTSSASITNAMITDERAVWNPLAGGGQVNGVLEVCGPTGVTARFSISQADQYRMDMVLDYLSGLFSIRDEGNNFGVEFDPNVPNLNLKAMSFSVNNVPVIDTSGHIVLAQGLPVAARHCVLKGPVTGGGVPNLIPQSQIGNTLATGITLKCTASPTLVTSANGIDTITIGRQKNTSLRFDSDIAVVGLTANSTNYIWMDPSAGTAGFVTVADTDQHGGTIPVTNHQHTFDFSPGGMQMYLGNGSTAPASNHVIVAEVDTNGTVVTAIRCRAYAGRYESGLVATLPGSTPVSANHNLGTREVNAQKYIECITTDLGYAVGDRVESWNQDNGSDQSVTSTWWNKLALGFSSGVNNFLISQKGTSSTPVAADATKWKYGFSARRNY